MKKVALLIGIDKYDDSNITRLKYAANDVISMGEKLQQDCNFDDVRLLTNLKGTKPTNFNIIRELEDIALEINSDDLFMFFFSGHGIENNEHAYFLTQDSFNDYPDTAFSFNRLKEIFQKISAKQRIVLIDACRNDPHAGKGVADNLMGNIFSKDLVTSVTETKNIEDSTTAIFTACSKGQRAYEWEKKQHGIFTYFMLKGLGGDAWNGGKLCFKDLVNYTSQKVKEWAEKAKKTQTPWYEEFGNYNPMILADKNSIKKREYNKPLKLLDKFEASEAICEIIKEKGSKKYFDQIWETNIKGWQKEEDNKKPEAQWLIGYCYQEGLKFEKNINYAINLYEKAAAQGCAMAINSLGECYYYGKGVNKDKIKAISLYKKASALGNPIAQNNLAFFYNNHKTLKNKAIKLVNEFGKQDYRGQIKFKEYNHRLFNGTNDEIEDYKLIENAAEIGYADAQIFIGNCYYKGRCVFTNKKNSFKWYKKAAEQGNDIAQFYLGIFYYYGDKIPIDKVEAEKWFRKSSEHGNPKAKIMLKYIEQPLHEKAYTIINKIYLISKEILGNRFKKVTKKK